MKIEKMSKALAVNKLLLQPNKYLGVIEENVYELDNVVNYENFLKMESCGAENIIIFYIDDEEEIRKNKKTNLIFNHAFSRLNKDIYLCKKLNEWQ